MFSLRLPMGASRWSFLREGGFIFLVGAAIVNQFGSEVSQLAIPLAAILILHASNASVAFIAFASSSAMLVFPLPIGIMADRYPRKMLLIIADVVAAVAALIVPLLGWAGGLSLPALITCVVIIGCCAMLHEVCTLAIIPQLVRAAALDSCNAALSTGESVAEVAGPGVGGLILSAIGLFGGLVLDGLSFICSALLVSRITVHADSQASSGEPAGKGTAGGWREGFRYLKSDQRLWRLTGCSTTMNFFASMAGAVEILFLVRDLHVSVGEIGILFSASAVGGLTGGALLGRLRAWLGPIRVIAFAQLVLAAPLILIPFARPGLGVAFYLIGWFFYALSSVMYDAGVMTYLQRALPENILGKTWASQRWLSGGAVPLGAAAGAALVSFLSIRTVVAISSFGMYVSGAWLCTRSFMRNDTDSGAAVAVPSAEAGRTTASHPAGAAGSEASDPLERCDDV